MKNMKDNEKELYSRVIEKGASWDEADLVVIWYHGFGADAADCAPIGDVLPEMGVPGRVRYLFPEADERWCVIPEVAGRARSWYDYERWFPTVKVRETVDEAVERVLAFVGRLGERGFPPSKIVLAGFSQGGALAVETAIVSRLPFAGLVALSCDFPLLYGDRAGDLEHRLFIGHGTYDAMVPMSWKTTGVGELRRSRLAIEEHDYPGLGHGICREELRDVAAFITPMLG